MADDMPNLAQRVHQIADQLPQDATWEDVRRRVDEVAGADTVALLKILARGKQQIEAGQVVALDEAVAQIKARRRKVP